MKSRTGTLPTSGTEIITHEFDWAETQVVYEEDEITVTSFPAIRGMVGAVSYRIDLNGRNNPELISVVIPAPTGNSQSRSIK